MKENHLKVDTENTYLARAPRFRLQGEFIRDNALAVSGLLNPKMGGPGVKPYQPPGLWAEVGLSGRPIFKRDEGEKLYRRSIYSYWKRSAPPPNMQIFDAPTREKCTVVRARTNTPLQALVLLNDVQYVEAARRFAVRILQESSANDDKRLNYAFMLALAREPSFNEQEVLLDLLNQSRSIYANDQAAAKELLSHGEAPNPSEYAPEEQAAWTIIASTILNLDEVINRN